MILEALEELFNDLLGESHDIHSLQGMRIVRQYASLHSLVGSQSECLQHLENEATSGLKEHENILSEISSAIAQLRPRFNEAIANGKSSSLSINFEFSLNIREYLTFMYLRIDHKEMIRPVYALLALQDRLQRVYHFYPTQ